MWLQNPLHPQAVRYEAWTDERLSENRHLWYRVEQEMDINIEEKTNTLG